MVNIDKNYWDTRAGEFLEKGIEGDIPLLVEVVTDYVLSLQDITKNRKIKVLEVGCGEGRVMAAVDAKVGNIIDINGIDYSPRMVAINKYSLTHKATTSDAVDTEFENNAFDIIYTHSCLMHNSHQKIKQVIEELVRISNIIILAEWQGIKDETRAYANGKDGVFSHDYNTLFTSAGCEILQKIQTEESRSVWIIQKKKKQPDV